MRRKEVLFGSFENLLSVGVYANGWWLLRVERAILLASVSHP